MSVFNELVRAQIVLPSRPPEADAPACPKCRYTGDARDDHWKTYLWVSSGNAARHNMRDEHGNPLGECLMVRCGRCGYRWHEEVATPEESSAPS